MRDGGEWEGDSSLHKPRLGVLCAGSCCCCLQIFKLFHRISKMTKRHAPPSVSHNLLLPPTNSSLSCLCHAALASPKQLLLPAAPTSPQVVHNSCKRQKPPPTVPSWLPARAWPGLPACSARDLRLTIIIGD